jgi:hypothetical protein
MHARRAAVVWGGLVAGLIAGGGAAPAQTAGPNGQDVPQAHEEGAPRAARSGQLDVPPFSFQLPSGWRDLSRDAPAQNFSGLPPEAVLAAKQVNADVDGFAALVDGAQRGNAAFMTIETYECPGRFTKEALQALVSAQADLNGKDIEVVSSDLVKINGVTAARLVLATQASGTRVRGLQYHLPSGGTCAAVTYLTEDPAFDHFLPVFEAAARATTGLQEKPAAPTD